VFYLLLPFSEVDELPEVVDPDLAAELLPEVFATDSVDDDELLAGVLTDLPAPELLSADTLDFLSGAGELFKDSVLLGSLLTGTGSALLLT
jgi:hypothetical protein